MSENIEILEQISQIQSLIRVSTDVLPFLDELFCFLQDISPLMEEIKHSVKESSAKIPSAAQNLKQVTHSTEMATTQILDRLDSIINKFSDISTDMSPENANHVNVAMDEAIEIMNGLQFQDITAQKIEHSQRILGAIEKKFYELYDTIGTMNKISPIAGKLIGDTGTTKQSEREDTRSEFSEKTRDIVRKDGFNQDEIDNLFKKK